MISEQFKKDGFVFLRNVFDPKDLENFEKLIIDLAKKLILQSGGEIPKGDSYDLLRFVEKNYKVPFFHLCAHVGCGIAGVKLLTEQKITKVISELTGGDPNQLYPFHPAVFYNDRAIKRLQTSFHQEKSYFPFATDVYHLWFPLFRNLKDEDGPMIVCKGSHTEHYPYTVIAAPQSITRLETNEDIVARFEKVPCSLNRGDAVLFHNNTIHATGENLTSIPRISGVIRYMNLLNSSEKFEPYIKFVYSEKSTKDEIGAKADKVLSNYES